MEKCPHCDAMVRDNKILRKALTDTNKQYVEVINESLLLKKELEDLKRIKQ